MRSRLLGLQYAAMVLKRQNLVGRVRCSVIVAAYIFASHAKAGITSVISVMIIASRQRSETSQAQDAVHKLLCCLANAMTCSHAELPNTEP